MLELANQFNNQNILIYGFGKSGRACFKYLRKNNKIEIYDDKKSSIPKNLKKNSINKTKLTSVNFDRIVVSPGIDINKCTLKKYLSKNKSKIISELDIFYLNNIKNKKITITGGLFVFEAISVIVQVISFKLTGKRVFKMAPIHHHFEKKGWSESTVVIRFWIISIILAMIGLATLKLR